MNGNPISVTIPNPRFIVFYNGIDKQPEKKELYLSDAYEHKERENNENFKEIIWGYKSYMD